MPTFVFEPADREELTETIHDLAAYVAADDRALYLALADRLENGEEAFEENPLDTVMELGRQTWPARKAVRHYLQEEAADEEWEQLLGYARPLTVVLLKRLRKQSDEPHVEGALASDAAAFALGTDEAREIAMLRAEIGKRIWQERGEDLLPYVTVAENKLEELEKAMENNKQQNELAEDPAWEVYVNGADTV